MGRAQLALAPDLLHQSVAKPGQGSRDSADLVGSCRRDRHINSAGIESVHRHNQPAQWDDDRTQHQKGEQNAVRTAAHTMICDNLLALAASLTTCSRATVASAV